MALSLLSHLEMFVFKSDHGFSINVATSIAMSRFILERVCQFSPTNFNLTHMKKRRLVCETNQTGKKIQGRGRGGGGELPPKFLVRFVTFFLKPVCDSLLSDVTQKSMPYFRPLCTRLKVHMTYLSQYKRMMFSLLEYLFLF